MACQNFVVDIWKLNITGELMSEYFSNHLVYNMAAYCNLETHSTLRARGHRFSLPQCKSKLFKDAYLNPVLFLYF